MRILLLLLAAGLALELAPGSKAADFDGSKPFLCATIDVASCVPGRNCERESAETVNAPQFVDVDVEKKLVSATGTNATARSSKIERIEHRSGLLLLSGTDGAEGWIAAIGENSGKLSYAVVGDRVGVMAFGACLNR